MKPLINYLDASIGSLLKRRSENFTPSRHQLGGLFGVIELSLHNTIVRGDRSSQLENNQQLVCNDIAQRTMRRRLDRSFRSENTRQYVILSSYG